MKKIILIQFILLTIFMALEAQPLRPTGCVMDELANEAYNQVPMLPKYSGKKFTSRPIRIDLKPYCPTPGDQGDLGSCTAWSTAYGAFTISKAIQEGITDQEQINAMARSVMFIYNYTRIDPNRCELGARMTDALERLREFGDCLYTEFDVRGEDQDGCDEKADQTQFSSAYENRIKDYATLYAREDKPDFKIVKTKKTLANKAPVVVGMKITPSFFSIQGDTWDPTEDEQVFPGGHAMVVVGYDQVKGVFELLNSYGPNWGNNGYIYIKYDDFGRLCKYGFQLFLEDRKSMEEIPEEIQDEITKDDPEMEDKEDDPILVNIRGSFNYRTFDGYETDDFGNEVTDSEGNPVINWKYNNAVKQQAAYTYQLEQAEWPTGTNFQLLAEGVPAGKYVYVFSIDPNNKLEFHWPREPQEELEERLMDSLDREETFALSNRKISSLVSGEDEVLVMPGDDYAMELDQTGEDHLIILYSDEEIEDVRRRANRIRNSEGEIHVRLQQVFDDLLIAEDNIKYNPERMQFVAACKEGKGSMVPIILTIQGI